MFAFKISTSHIFHLHLGKIELQRAWGITSEGMLAIANLHTKDAEARSLQMLVKVKLMCVFSPETHEAAVCHRWGTSKMESRLGFLF